MDAKLLVLQQLSPVGVRCKLSSLPKDGLNRVVEAVVQDVSGHVQVQKMSQRTWENVGGQYDQEQEATAIVGCNAVMFPFVRIIA